MEFKGNLGTPHSAHVKLVSSFLFTALENTWPFLRSSPTLESFWPKAESIKTANAPASGP